MKNRIRTLNIKSLLNSVCPILLTTAMAFGDGIHNFNIAFKILAITVSIHIAINILTSHKGIQSNLKELSAFFIFGPILVSMTYYLQSYEMNYGILLAGISPGLISASGYLITRLKSREGIKSERAERILKTAYCYLITTASLLPVLIYGLINDHLIILSCSTICLFAIPNFKRILSETDVNFSESALNINYRLLLIYTILFSAGWIF